MIDHETKNLNKGFIPVMLTPFEQNGAIDYASLTRLTEFYMEAGAVGMFANCLSSEMFDLTPAERIGITKHVVNLTQGAIPIVATGNFGETIAQQADSVKRMYETGVEAVILVTSLLARPDDDEETFTENAMQLLELTETIPVGFYECPAPYKRTLNPQQLKAFLETNRLVYFKDTCLDIEQVRAKIMVAKGYDFRIYDAYMAHAVESLKAGTDGLSCIQGNYFPELIVWLCQNYDNLDVVHEVNEVQEFLIKNMDVMHAIYPVVAKYFLQKRGVNISTFSRTHNAIVKGSTKEAIDLLFEEYKDVRAAFIN